MNYNRRNCKLDQKLMHEDTEDCNHIKANRYIYESFSMLV